MATLCPVCKKGTLKVGDTQVYCSEKKWNNTTKKNDGCDFHIFFDQKKTHYGEVITAGDIKKLVEGQTLKNKEEKTIELDLSNTKFFIKTTKPADKDL